MYVRLLESKSWCDFTMFHCLENEMQEEGTFYSIRKKALERAFCHRNSINFTYHAMAIDAIKLKVLSFSK